MTKPATPTQRFRPAACWTLRGGAISLERSVVMGIVNVTPDSFSDGGLHVDAATAIAHGARLIEEGADIVDIGGESTRPGAEPVDEAEQIRRTVPVIERLAGVAAACGVAISIDTTRAEVARAAIAVGAAIVNDVSGGLDDPSLLEVVASSGAGVVLMHRLRPPRHDQYSDRYSDHHESAPAYGDVVADVCAALRSRRDAALAAGVPESAIAIDPGLGFGKDVAQNMRLVAELDKFVDTHPIVLIGASRKSFIGAVARRGDGPPPPPAERLPGSLAIAAICRLRGASIFRVHDVAAMRQALAATDAVIASGIENGDIARSPGTSE